jgi:TonB-linked SusC/RagA family outer membrane protein
LIGQEAQILNNSSVSAGGTSIYAPGLTQVSSTRTRSGSDAGQIKNTLLSWFGQVNYGYKNRYFLSNSIRADGASNFGERNRFGLFWSSGLGWVVSQEKFMQQISSWLSYLKLRGSIGMAGNSFAINRFVRYDLLGNGTYQNNFAVYSYSGKDPGNPDIKWEKTNIWNAGLEARLFNDRISFTADIYSRLTHDAVSTITLPSVTGYTQVKDNIGDIRNSGIELSVNFDLVKSKNFKWNVNANWSTNNNKLIRTSMPLTYVGGSASTPLVNLIGKPINSFYMYRWAGVNSATGMGMFIDSTGKPTTNVSAGKPQYVGKPQPDGFGAMTHSFSYKNFSVSALFYYQYGYQVNSSGLGINDGSSPYQNQVKYALNRWQKPGDIAPNPKRISPSPSSNNTTRFLFDGDFIRLQTLNLEYTFSTKKIARLGVKSLKLYAQAYNLVVWTKYPGDDLADVGIVGQTSTSSSYPNARSFSLGIDLNF